ncbi:hypothetical protein [Actinoplanes utahensis]|uniref:Uncharacterized protein n=1 Tax=Actinoplanes utahensis TaxID=1869 RepID=A0A0A6UJV6_ACTUT|nr:hypothetical protein [Actinoplanes utahensis]KHD75726.1 hypothetical protein MB27_21135 [Actinoplanes utahensis]
MTTTTTTGPSRSVAPALTFPGPWPAGVSLVAGPLLMLSGTLLRLGIPFFFPDQLTAYQRDPTLIGTAYALFLAGAVTLWPGIVAVAARVGVTHPGWAVWGGSLVVFGLFARTFHHGVDTFAFALSESSGPAFATGAVSAYYAYPEWVAASLSLAVMLGWIVLAVGCYLSGTLRLLPALALALMSGLMIGVLKGSTWASAVQVTGLAVALVPLGVTFLREAARPSARTVATVVLFLAASIVLGRLG